MLPRLEDMTDEQVAPFLQAARDLLAYANDKQTKRNIDRKAIDWAHNVIARINKARGLQ